MHSAFLCFYEALILDLSDFLQGLKDLYQCDIKDVLRYNFVPYNTI